MKTEIIKFHESDIYCPIRDGQVYVAIKPICEALGIDAKSQRRSIQNDKIYAQLGSLMTSTGRDSKQYEMYCLPLQYVFGWLMKIDSSAVKPESQGIVLSYQRECCDVLYRHFVEKADRYQKRDKQILELQDKVDQGEEQRKPSLRISRTGKRK